MLYNCSVANANMRGDVNTSACSDQRKDNFRMASSDSTKTCSTCQQEKPITEFYEHSRSRDGYFSDCKSCYIAKRKDYRPTFRDKAGNEGERIVIDKLRSMGVYAAPGKSSEWKNIDVVAWGCVRIEVKLSRPNPLGLHITTLRAKNVQTVLKSDLFVLLCVLETGNRFYVLPANHSVLHDESGYLKTGLSFNPHSDSKLGTVNRAIQDHEDRWDLIDIEIERVKSDLMNI